MLRGTFGTGLVMVLSVLANPGSAQGQRGIPWEAGGPSQGEDLSIYLATFGPGDPIHQYFGHTALEVMDHRRGVRALYNFGLFSFGGDMLPKFLMGRLEFWLGVQNPATAYRFYRGLDRDARRLELNLEPNQRLKMAQALAENARPENAMYLYHHYRDNCATRIVDLIDAAVDGQYKAAYAGPARLSFRDHTRRYAAVNPAVSWILMLLMNQTVDNPIRQVDEQFLPDELELGVKSFSYRSSAGEMRPLAGHETVIATAQNRSPTPFEPPRPWKATLTWGLLFGGLSAGLGWTSRRRQHPTLRRALGGLQAIYGFVFGFIGLVMLFVATLTDHDVAHWNENLLFCTPLGLLGGLAGIGVARGRHPARAARVWLAVAALSLAGMALKLIPGAGQDNLEIWTLLLPLHLGLAAGAYWHAGATQRSAQLPASVPDAA